VVGCWSLRLCPYLVDAVFRFEPSIDGAASTMCGYSFSLGDYIRVPLFEVENEQRRSCRPGFEERRMTG
jgi:hypothetical protein